MLKHNADILLWMCHFCITMFSKKKRIQDYDPAAATALLLLRSLPHFVPAPTSTFIGFLYGWLLIPLDIQF